MPFTLGQRWISDTESELGLGTVVAVDARTVTLLFPSTGENRLYARSDSPVTRVMFNPGDTITSHDGWQMQVEEVKEENIKSYLIGIAVNKIKKHYSILSKIKRINMFDKNDEINNIKDDIDIEDLIIKNDDWDIIWKYIKNKKNKDIGKVFYLHYKLELSIKEIASELNKNESYVKNLIYRTLKELCALFGKECD